MTQGQKAAATRKKNAAKKVTKTIEVALDGKVLLDNIAELRKAFQENSAVLHEYTHRQDFPSVPAPAKYDPDAAGYASTAGVKEVSPVPVDLLAAEAEARARSVREVAERLFVSLRYGGNSLDNPAMGKTPGNPSQGPLKDSILATTDHLCAIQGYLDSIAAYLVNN